jgi:hypothetical protein
VPLSLSELTRDAIETLVSAGTPEDRFLEYKEALPDGGDEARREFVADVSALANAGGGDLIFGVVEKRDASGKPTGAPDTAPGVSVSNTDAEVRRLTQMIRDGIAPRIAGAQVVAIDGFPLGPVFVCRVPASWLAPHMVTLKGLNRFYLRVGSSKQPMDVHEVREAVLASEGRTSRLAESRAERLGRILSGDTAVALKSHAKLVVHLAPARFPVRPEVDVALARNRSSDFVRSPHYIRGWDTRWNLEGYVAYAASAQPDGAGHWYTQIHRAGMIEIVDALTFLGERTSPVLIEDEIIEYAGLALHSARAFEIAPPFVIMPALVGVRDQRLTLSPADYHVMNYASPPFGRDVVQLPEVYMEDVSADLGKLLRPTFDVLWQAAGWACSFSYDDRGNRRKR